MAWPFSSSVPASIYHSSATSHTLSHLIRQCPSVQRGFQPYFLYFNGHLQTLASVLQSSTPNPAIYYDRYVLRLDDGGSLSLDFVTGPFDQSDNSLLPPRTRLRDTPSSKDDAPLLVILHGLTGGSHEGYIRSTIEQLCTNHKQWWVVVINARGCAKSQLTTPKLFRANPIDDIHAAMQHLHRMFPNRPFYMSGYSLGANALVCYLAEYGEASKVRAAVSVANPWDLYKVNALLMENWFLKQVYARTMGSSLRNLFLRHLPMMTTSDKFDVAAIQAARYMDDYDAQVTVKTFPQFKDVDDYYTRASAYRVLGQVKVPMLALNALDDPISRREAYPLETIKETPSVVLVTTAHGGHLGWVGPNDRWFACVIEEFLTRMHNVDENLA